MSSKKLADDMNLWEKISHISNDLRGLQKTGKNDFQRYDYFSEGDILNAVKPLLVKYGICLVPTIREYKTGGAEENFLIEVALDIRVVNTAKPSEFDVITWVGSGRDVDSKGKPMDKGLPKALTGGYKQAVGKLFSIAEGFDPENESEDLYSTNNKPKPVAAAQPKPVAAAQREAKPKPTRPYSPEVLLQLAKDTAKKNLVPANSSDIRLLVDLFAEFYGEADGDSMLKLLMFELFSPTRLDESGEVDISKMTAGEHLFLSQWFKKVDNGEASPNTDKEIEDLLTHLGYDGDDTEIEND